MASTGQREHGGELAVPLSAGRASAPALPAAIRRPRWWLDVLVIVWLGWVYDMVTNLAPLRQRAALGHGEALLALERALHLDPELALNRWLVGQHTLGVVLSYYYDNAHFIVTFGLLGWLWWRRADLYRPLRNSLVLMNVIGLVVFWLYPVAPPRMLQGFTDVVATSNTFGSWHTGSLASAADQFAAMPSLHMAWAAWCSLALWQLSGRVWVRALALLYPCVTCLAVLSTGNHYLIDVLAGLAAAALAVALAGGLARALPAVGTACHKLVTKFQTR